MAGGNDHDYSAVPSTPPWISISSDSGLCQALLGLPELSRHLSHHQPAGTVQALPFSHAEASLSHSVKKREPTRATNRCQQVTVPLSSGQPCPRNPPAETPLQTPGRAPLPQHPEGAQLCPWPWAHPDETTFQTAQARAGPSHQASLKVRFKKGPL